MYFADEWSLNMFKIADPIPVFTNTDGNLLFSADVTVSCTKDDCSAFTDGSDNYRFKLYFDRDSNHAGSEKGLDPVVTHVGRYGSGQPATQADLT